MGTPQKGLSTIALLLFTCLSCGTQHHQKEQNADLESNSIEVNEIEEVSETPTDRVYNQLKNGEKDGLWKEFDKNDRLISEGYYINGKANGMMKWYHDKGHLAGEGPMKDDKRDGLWKVYTVEDGNLSAEVYFEAGKEAGIRKLYHNNGQLKKENIWKDNKIISEKCWNEKGDIIECKPV